FLGNRPQARQVHGHRKAGQLPDGGDHHGDQRQGDSEGNLTPLHAGNHPGVHVPLGKLLQSPLLQKQVDPRGRVEDPLPHHTRHDEGQGHGKDENIAKHGLAADSAVQHNRQEKAQPRRQDDEEHREHERVAQIRLEAEITKQAQIVFQPRPGPIGNQGVPFREGNGPRPADKSVNEDGDCQERGKHQQKRHPLFLSPHPIAPSPVNWIKSSKGAHCNAIARHNRPCLTSGKRTRRPRGELNLSHFPIPLAVAACFRAPAAWSTSPWVTKVLMILFASVRNPSAAAEPWAKLGVSRLFLKSSMVCLPYSSYLFTSASTREGIDPFSGLNTSCPSTEPSTLRKALVASGFLAPLGRPKVSVITMKVPSV